MSEFKSNMTDAELDDLFRKAADRMETPVDEASWGKIASRLDRYSKGVPPQGWGIRRALVLTAAAAALVALIWYSGSLWPVQKKSTSMIPQRMSSSSSSTYGSSSWHGNRPSDSMKMQQVLPSKSSDSRIAGSVTAQLNGTQASELGTAKGSIHRSEQPEGAAGGSRVSIQHDASWGNKGLLATTLEPSPVLFNQPVLLNPHEVMKLAILSQFPDQLAMYGHTGSKDQEKSISSKQLTAADKMSSAAPVKTDSTSHRPWDVSVVSGPDWSAVKNSPWGNPGLDLGIFTGYHFHIPISVHVGFVIVGKKYGAQPSQYHPKRTYLSSEELHEITAVCRAVNIPLEVRYDIWKKGSNHLALGLGASSYWFLREEYTYHYKTIDQPYDRHLEFENESRNLFSELSVSLDYDHYLSQKMSIGVRPYYQFPLAGIGYGRVYLRSAGTVVSLAFHF